MLWEAKSIRNTGYMKYRFSIPIFFILVQFFAYPQYSEEDTILILTTSSRKYDHNLLYNYLHSGDERKINAALLSIANSADTTFIPLILDNKIKYRDKSNLYFTLSLLGNSQMSAEFLWKELHRTQADDTSHLIVNAIGNTGDSSDLQKLLASKNECGISEAILNFHLRGIRSNLSFPVLEQELSSADDKISVKAMYTINRMGLSKQYPEKIKEIFFEEINKKNFNTEKVYYSLTAFRRAGNSPLTLHQVSELLPNFDFNCRIELARVAAYSEYSVSDELNTIFLILSDSNPNVAISMATAVAEMKIKSEQVKNDFYSRALEFILKRDFDQNIGGYLFLSLCSLFPDSAISLRHLLHEVIPSKLLYRSFSVSSYVSEEEISLLIQKIRLLSEAEAAEIANALVVNRIKWQQIHNFDSELLQILSETLPAAVLASFCEKLDTAFISGNAEKISASLKNYIIYNKNNFEASAAYANILRVLEICSLELAEEAKSLINTSDVLTTSVVLPRKRGEKAAPIKDTSKFRELISRSFIYHSAEIITNKGIIQFRLLPEYAPLTVGNFVALAEKGFYDGVKFHRVVPGFVIQSGDTSGTGWYGPGYQIVSEFSYLRFEEGTAGIASNGPDTEGSQWFFMQKDFPHLNGRYTVWGQCTNGLDIIRRITESDQVIGIKLLK